MPSRIASSVAFNEAVMDSRPYIADAIVSKSTFSGRGSASEAALLAIAQKYARVSQIVSSLRSLIAMGVGGALGLVGSNISGGIGS